MESKESRQESLGSKEWPKFSDPMLWIAGVVLVIALVSVSVHFGNSDFGDCNLIQDAEKKSDCLKSEQAEYRSAWGQFGDFMGGVVNPIFGFLTIWLLVTELKATRRATEEARIAQEKTERALRDQLKEAKFQNAFSNYYKHLEEFERFYLKIVDKGHEYCVFKADVRWLHSFIYPAAKNGVFAINSEVAEAIANAFKKLVSPLTQCNAYEVNEKNIEKLKCAKSSMEKNKTAELFGAHLSIDSHYGILEGEDPEYIKHMKFYLDILCFDAVFVYRNDFHKCIKFLSDSVKSIDDAVKQDSSVQQLPSLSHSAWSHSRAMDKIIDASKKDSANAI